MSLLVGTPSALNPIVQCINISDELLATVDADGVIQVWNISTAQEIFKLERGEEKCSFICYVEETK